MPHGLKHAWMTCMSFDQGVRQDYKLDYISVPALIVYMVTYKTPGNADGYGFNYLKIQVKLRRFKRKPVRRKVSSMNRPFPF